MKIGLCCAIAQLACSSASDGNGGTAGAAASGAAGSSAGGRAGAAGMSSSGAGNSGAGNAGGSKPSGGAAGQAGQPEAGGTAGSGTAGNGTAGSGGTAGMQGTAGKGGNAGSGNAGSGGTAGMQGAAGKGGAAGGGGTAGMQGAAGKGGAGGLPGGGGAGNASFVSEFSTGMDSWASDFSDYPQGQETFYELQGQQAPLPSELGVGGGVLMRGNNHSDDLFMYLTRQVQGLSPMTNYLLSLRVDIGTNAPADCGGVGGNPGSSVYFKIGASAKKPASTLDSQGILRLNIDKGQQSVGGTDMKVVGDLSNTLHCPDSTYQAKALSLSGFSVRSAADGSLWLVVGTDSGFEGLTSLYYDKITVTLTPG